MKCIPHINLRIRENKYISFYEVYLYYKDSVCYPKMLKYATKQIIFAHRVKKNQSFTVSSYFYELMKIPVFPFRHSVWYRSVFERTTFIDLLEQKAFSVFIRGVPHVNYVFI